jgi:hypothetical protein
MQPQTSNLHAYNACKVCGCGRLRPLFSTNVLGAYHATVVECLSCGFQYFPNAQEWIQEAYSSPIASTDTGIVARCLDLHKIISSFLSLNYKRGPLLDWGSGSGLLVRLLRDSGHECLGFEPYTAPVLAAGYTFTDDQAALQKAPFRAIIAVEVLEHLTDPREFMASVLAMTDTLIFTTELLNGNKVGKAWWYYSFETGQHIGFYTKNSLERLAYDYDCFYYTCRNPAIHIFTRNPLDIKAFRLIAGRKRAMLLYPLSRLVDRLSGRKSLTMADHVAAKESLTAV